MRPVKTKKPRSAKRRSGRQGRFWPGFVTKAASLLIGMLLFLWLGLWTAQQELLRVASEKAALTFRAQSEDWGLTVQEVLSIGRQRTKIVDIRQKVEKFYGHNIFSVDIRTMRNELESLPWIRSATVTRQFPDRLILNIAERKPMAVWKKSNGTLKLIDERGDIIPVSDIDPFISMPVVSGEGAPQHTADLFKALLKHDELARRVTGAQRINDRRWNIFLDETIEVRMPNHDIEGAWSALAEAHAKDKLLERAIKAVDLRSEDWLIIQLMEEAVEASRGQPV